MRNALIGAFVLSVMLAPYAAYGKDGIQINSDTGMCHVFDAAGDSETLSGGDVKIAVGIKANGGATAKCTDDLLGRQDEGIEFSSDVTAIDCTITTTTDVVVAEEWTVSISPQGKRLLKCSAAGLEDQPFCDRHPFHRNCND